MNGKIDFFLQQRVFDLLDENPLADGWNRASQEAVAAGLDLDDFDAQVGVMLFQLTLDPFRLCQSQSAAAGADADEVHTRVISLRDRRASSMPRRTTPPHARRLVFST